MDIALILDSLVPGAEYRGSLTENDQSTYEGLEWLDNRPKPDWAAIEASATSSAKAGLVAYAADARWRREVGGITVGGMPVATDDRSKLMVTGARLAAVADPEWTTIWHGADGQTYPIDAEAMVVLSDAVQAHVNATFATFASVKAEIEAGTITAAPEIDAAFAI